MISRNILEKPFENMFSNILESIFINVWCYFYGCCIVDVISAIEFDKSGDYLAVGDRGGRVVIFEKKAGKDVRITFLNILYLVQFCVFCFFVVGFGFAFWNWLLQLEIASLSNVCSWLFS